MGRTKSLMVHLTLGALALGTAGCKRAPEAPKELSRLAGFLFEHMMDEDDGELVAGVDNLHVWLKKNHEETFEGYKVTDLKESVVNSVDPGRDHDLSNLGGASVGAVVLGHGVEPIADALVLAEQEEVFPETYVVHDRTYVGDKSCFMPRGCDSVTTDNYVESDFGLITTTTESRAQYRWVDFDGGTALLHRTWLTEEADVGGTLGGAVKVKEQLYFGITYPWSGDNSLRLGTTWIAAEIAGADFEEMAVNTMIDSMSKEAGKLQVYLD